MEKGSRIGPTVFALVSGGFGGGQQIALQVAEALSKRSVPVAVCAPTNGVAIERFEALGAQVLITGEIKTHDLGLRRRFTGWLDDIDARCLYTHTVPTHETLLGRSALNAQARLVVHRHILGAFSSSTWKRATQIRLWRRVLRHAFAIPSVSTQVADQVSELGADPVVIYNGVPIPEDPGQPSQRPPVVGFVGRFDPQKRVEDFVSMARSLRDTHPQARFLMVGASSQPETYERTCLRLIETDDLQGRLEVRQFTPDVKSVMHEIDILVMPSLLEGHPLVLLEAMALRKAVVAANIPGCRETVTDGVDGRLFPPRALQELCKIVAALIDDESQRHRLGATARATVIERFPINLMLERILPLVS